MQAMEAEQVLRDLAKASELIPSGRVEGPSNSAEAAPRPKPKPKPKKESTKLKLREQSERARRGSRGMMGRLASRVGGAAMSLVGAIDPVSAMGTGLEGLSRVGGATRPSRTDQQLEQAARRTEAVANRSGKLQEAENSLLVSLMSGEKRAQLESYSATELNQRKRAAAKASTALGWDRANMVDG